MKIIHVLNDRGAVTFIDELAYQVLKERGGREFDEFVEAGYEEVFLKDDSVVRRYIQARQTAAVIETMGRIGQWAQREYLAEARQKMADCLYTEEEGEE